MLCVVYCVDQTINRIWPPRIAFGGWGWVVEEEKKEILYFHEVCLTDSVPLSVLICSLDK